MQWRKDEAHQWVTFKMFWIQKDCSNFVSFGFPMGSFLTWYSLCRQLCCENYTQQCALREINFILWGTPTKYLRWNAFGLRPHANMWNYAYYLTFFFKAQTPFLQFANNNTIFLIELFWWENGIKYSSTLLDRN